MFTWSQLLSLLEAENYTELAIGETPYLDYLLNINIYRFRFPQSTPGRSMAGIGSSLYFGSKVAQLPLLKASSNLYSPSSNVQRFRHLIQHLRHEIGRESVQSRQPTLQPCL